MQHMDDTWASAPDAAKLSVIHKTGLTATGFAASTLQAVSHYKYVMDPANVELAKEFRSCFADVVRTVAGRCRVTRLWLQIRSRWWAQACGFAAPCMLTQVCRGRRVACARLAPYVEHPTLHCRHMQARRAPCAILSVRCTGHSAGSVRWHWRST